MWISGAPSLHNSFSGNLSGKLQQPYQFSKIIILYLPSTNLCLIWKLPLGRKTKQSWIGLIFWVSLFSGIVVLHCFPMSWKHCTTGAFYILLNPWFISLKVHFNCFMERRLGTCINLLNIMKQERKATWVKCGSRKRRDTTDLRHILEINWPWATR